MVRRILNRLTRELTANKAMRKNTEIYGISKPQDGRKSNEDAFAIIRVEIPVIAVCDGAGNAEQSAKKVIGSFQG